MRSLIYPPHLKASLLNLVHTSLLFADLEVDPDIVALNRSAAGDGGGGKLTRQIGIASWSAWHRKDITVPRPISQIGNPTIRTVSCDVMPQPAAKADIKVSERQVDRDQLAFPVQQMVFRVGQAGPEALLDSDGYGRGSRMLCRSTDRSALPFFGVRDSS